NSCDNVSTFNVACGSKEGYGTMSDNPENPSWNKLNSFGSGVQVVPIEVPEKVALMKIDVEGLELEVIKGAYKVIEREKPELFVEWHDGYESILNALPKG